MLLNIFTKLALAALASAPLAGLPSVAKADDAALAPREVPAATCTDSRPLS
ncbi:MAG TPA: hypothetical protein VJY34_25045 [Roseiarcus sp.]|nr:hypothetical protein [Roseiarcus sp.]